MTGVFMAVSPVAHPLLWRGRIAATGFLLLFCKAGLSSLLISDKNGNFRAKPFLPNQAIITIIINNECAAPVQ
jgi:hypothetical protein